MQAFKAFIDRGGKFGNRHLQSTRQAPKNADSGLLLAGLHERYERPVKLNLAGKCFLRQIQFKPSSLDGGRKGLDQKRVSAESHPCRISALCCQLTRVY